MAELQRNQAGSSDVLQSARPLEESHDMDRRRLDALLLEQEAMDDDEKYSDYASGSSSCSSPSYMLPDIIIRRSYPFVKFDVTEAERIIKKVLADALEGTTYNFDTFSELTVQLSTKIKDQIKSEMYLPRYKIVASVTIAQLSHAQQAGGIGTCSKPLWNENTDNCAQASFVSPYIYATGVVYAAYYY